MTNNRYSEYIRSRASVIIILAFAFVLQHLAIAPVYAAPAITAVSSPVMVGGTMRIDGSGFTAGAKVNFFVSSTGGAINQGPLTPSTVSASSLSVKVPVNIALAQGVVALQVVNTDDHFAASALKTAQLAGAPATGIPTLSSIDGVGLAASSISYGVDNVETVVPQGSLVVLGGSGFDTVNGVAIDVFCAGGKVGPFFINPGNPNLSATAVKFLLPATGPYAAPVGPASFVVSNKGSDGSYAKKSNAVSAPIGSRIHVMGVAQHGAQLVVDGTGFSTLTVINLFNSANLNLGGMTAGGAPVIAITLVSDTELKFTLPAGAVPGPAYVQANNPPFVPFSSSGNDPGGAVILTNPALPTATATAKPSATPTPAGPSASATPKGSASPSPTATANPAGYGMLVAGGANATASALASAETYNEDTGSFGVTGSMGYPRQGHSATVLGNGTILIAGGHNAFSVRAMASAELYDIKSGTFSFTGTMNSARQGHSAVLLGNGKVLIAGGQNDNFVPVSVADIYDPSTGRFALTASMQDARVNAAAAVLKDGTVLIAGGVNNGGELSSAELYDAKGAGSVAVGSLSAARQGATATLLANGTVLITGGSAQNASGTQAAIASAEIYNPATKTFTRTGTMHSARRGHSATLLANGSVLIAGGFNDASGTAVAAAEIYNPATGTFTVAANLNSARFEHAAGTLSSGKVLIAGGFDAVNHAVNSAEIYDPATGRFTPAANLVNARAQAADGCFKTAAASSSVRLAQAN